MQIYDITHAANTVATNSHRMPPSVSRPSDISSVRNFQNSNSGYVAFLVQLRGLTKVPLKYSVEQQSVFHGFSHVVHGNTGLKKL